MSTRNPVHRFASAFGRLLRGLPAGFAMGSMVMAPALANPVGEQVRHGAASFLREANRLEVTNSAGAIIHWDRFSVAPNEITRFNQPDAASAVLNRVTGGVLSDIQGRLESNGRVFLINPAGIAVGADAVIDTAAFIGSTLNMTDADFLAGNLRFEGDTGTIESNGLIIAREGPVVLIAPNVTNAGLIRTEGGGILLAAGRKVWVSGPELMDIVFELQAPEDSVLNIGELLASGGPAKAFAGTLTQAGRVQADTVSINASGEIVLRASENLLLSADSETVAAAGTITVAAGDTAIIAGSVDASSDAGTGGTIDLLGPQVGIDSTAVIAADGADGGGAVHVGGNYLGQGPLPNSRAVVIAPAASISASATEAGDGGEVIVWSDELTRVHGDIAAAGGPNGGDGGFVETSSARTLQVEGGVDVSAPAGDGGTWLLDPIGIAIVASLSDLALANEVPDNGSACGGFFQCGFPGGFDSLFSQSTLEQSEVTTRTLYNALIGDPGGTLEPGTGSSVTSGITVELRTVDTQAPNADIEFLAPLDFNGVDNGTLILNPNGPFGIVRFHADVFDSVPDTDALLIRVVSASADVAAGANVRLETLLEVDGDLNVNSGSTLDITGDLSVGGETTVLSTGLLRTHSLASLHSLAIDGTFDARADVDLNDDTTLNGTLLIGANTSIQPFGFNFVWDQGTIQGADPATSILFIDSDSSLTLGDVGDMVLAGATLSLEGSGNWNDNNLNAINNAVFAVDGTLAINASSAILDSTDATGTLRILPGGTLDAEFGNLQLLSTFESLSAAFIGGNVDFLGDGTHAGTYANSESAMAFSGGSHTWNAPDMSGADVTIDGADVFVTGGSVFAQLLTINSGTVTVDNAVSLLASSELFLEGGTLVGIGSGGVGVDGNATLLSGGGTVTLDAVQFFINGSADWDGGGTVVMQNGSILSTAFGGTLNVTASADIVSGGGFNILETAPDPSSVITVDGVGTVLNVGVDLVNNGVLVIQDSIVRATDGNGTGEFRFLQSLGTPTLAFDGSLVATPPTFTMQSGTTLTNPQSAGLISVANNGATLEIEGTTLAFENVELQPGGELHVSNNGELQITGLLDVSGAVLRGDSTSDILRIQGTADFSGAATTLTDLTLINEGSTTVSAATSATALQNTGTLTVDAAFDVDELTWFDGAITGSSTLTTSFAEINIDADGSYLLDGVTLVTTGNTDLLGNGTLTIENSGLWQNTGTLNVFDGQTKLVTSASNGAFHHGGAMVFGSGTTLNLELDSMFLASSTTLDATSTLNLVSGLVSFADGATVGGSGLLSSQDALEIGSGASVTIDSRFDSSGSIAQNGFLTLGGSAISITSLDLIGSTGVTFNADANVVSMTINGGTVTLGNAPITVSVSSLLDFTAGRLEGSGDNAAKIEVLDPASLLIGRNGNVQLVGATLVLDSSGFSQFEGSAIEFDDGHFKLDSGTFDFNGGTGLLNASFGNPGDVSIAVGATLRLAGASAAANVLVEVPIVNRGTLRIEDGALQIDAFRSVNQGAIELAGNAGGDGQLEITGAGELELAAGSSVTSVNVQDQLVVDGGTLLANVASTVDRLTLQSGAIDIANTTLGVVDRFEWTGGTVQGTNPATDILQVQSGAENLWATTTKIVNGATVQLDSTGVSSIWNGGLIETRTNAEVRINGELTATGVAGTGASGFFEVAPTGTLTFDTSATTFTAEFRNNGQVNMSSGGQLVLNGDGISGGSFSTVGGSPIRFIGGTHTLVNGADLLITVNHIDGGTLVIDAGATVDGGDMQLLSGELQNQGSLNFNAGSLTLAGGTFSGVGTTTIASSGLMSIEGSNLKTIEAQQLIVRANSTWSDGDIQLGDGALLQIDQAAVLNVTGASTQRIDDNGNGAAPFLQINEGTLDYFGSGGLILNAPTNVEGLGVLSGNGILLASLSRGIFGLFGEITGDVTYDGDLYITDGQVSGTLRSGTGNLFVADNAGATINAFDLSGGLVTLQQSTSTIDITTLDLSGGEFVGVGAAGAAVNVGDMNVTGGFGTVPVDNVDLFTSGSTAWSSNLQIDLRNGADWQNAGSIDLTGNGRLNSTTGGDLVNTGSITRSVPGTFDISALLDQQGTLNISDGTVRLDGGADFSGSGTTVTAPGILLLDGSATYTFAPGTVVNGDGRTQLGTSALLQAQSGGTVTVPFIDLGGSTLEALGTLDIGRLEWRSGTLSGSGAIDITDLQLVSVTAGRIIDTVPVTTSGATTWSDNGSVRLDNGASWTNSGTLDATGNATLDADVVGASVFTNTGTFNRTGSSGTFFVDTDFVQQGTLNVDNGRLQLNGGATFANADNNLTTPGILTLANGQDHEFLNLTGTAGSGTLELTNATLTVAIGHTVTLPHLRFAGGTTAITGDLDVTRLDWLAGTVQGGGTLDVVDLNLTGVTAGRILDATPLITTGTTDWSDNGSVRLDNGASWTNSGDFIASGDGSLASDVAGANNFTNSGTFTRTSSVSTFFVNTFFDQQGTLLVDNGTLNFSGGTLFGNADNTITAPGKVILASGPGHEFLNLAGTSGDGTLELTNATLTVASGHTVTLPDLRFAGGTAAIAGDLDVTTLNWVAGTVQGGGTLDVVDLNLTGVSASRILDAMPLTTTGTTTWSDNGSVRLDNGASWANSGDFIASGGGFLASDVAGANTFTNSGTFTRTSSVSTFFVNTFFDQQGTLLVDNGTLNFSGGTLFGNADNTITAPGKVMFASGPGHEFLNLAGTSGDGTLELTNATLTVASGHTVALPNLQFGGGTLNLAGDLDVTDLKWLAGTIQGGGTLDVVNLALNGVSASRILDAMPLTTTGTTTWSDNGSVRLDNGASWTNSGDFIAAGNGSLASDVAGANTFTNSGTFTRTSSASTFFVNTFFDQQGTLLVDNGTLNFSGGTLFGNADNTITAPGKVMFASGPGHEFLNLAGTSGDGTLELTNATLTVASGHTVALPNLQFGGGTLNLAGDLDVTDLKWLAGTIQGGGTLDVVNLALTGVSASRILDAMPLTTTGTTTWSDNGNVRLNNGASWTNSGTMALTGSATLDSDVFGGNSFTNFGFIDRNTNSSSFVINTFFDQQGELAVNSGGLLLFGGGLFNTALNTINAPASINFRSGLFTIEDPGTIVANGLNTIIIGNSATFEFIGNVNLDWAIGLTSFNFGVSTGNSLTLAELSLDPTSNLVIDGTLNVGTLNLDGTTVSGSGQLNVGTLELLGTGTHTFDSLSLLVSTEWIWTGTGPLSLDNGAFFEHAGVTTTVTPIDRNVNSVGGGGLLNSGSLFLTGSMFTYATGITAQNTGFIGGNDVELVYFGDASFDAAGTVALGNNGFIQLLGASNGIDGNFDLDALAVLPGAMVTIDGSVSINGLVNHGTTQLNVALAFDTIDQFDGSFEANAAVTANTLDFDGGTLTGTGSITVTDADFRGATAHAIDALTLAVTDLLSWSGAGVINIENGGELAWTGTSAPLSISGTRAIDSTTSGSFRNDGDIEILSGALGIRPTLTGGGTVTIDGGSVLGLAGSQSLQALEILDGSLTGHPDPAVDSLTLVDLTLASSSTMTFDGIDVTVTGNTTTDWTGSGDVLLENGSVWTNTGTLSASGGRAIRAGSSPGMFVNTGFAQFSSGTQVFEVDVESGGTLDLGTSSAGFTRLAITGGSLLVDGGLSVSDLLRFDAGEIDGSGSVVTVNAELAGATPRDINVPAFTTTGSVQFDAASLFLSAGTTWTNTGSLIADAATPTSINGAGVLVNTGTLRQQGSSPFTIAVFLDQQGTLEVISGGLEAGQGGRFTNAGNTVTTGTFLLLTGGATFDFDDGAGVSGLLQNQSEIVVQAGTTVIFDDGLINNNSLMVDGTLDLPGSTRFGSGAITTVNGTVNLIGGDLQVGNGVVVAGTGLVHFDNTGINAPAGVTFQPDVRMSNAMVHSGGAYIFAGDVDIDDFADVTFNMATLATSGNTTIGNTSVTVQNDLQWTVGGDLLLVGDGSLRTSSSPDTGLLTVANGGLLARNVSAGTFAIEFPVLQQGTLQVNTGTLSLDEGISFANAANTVASGATLELLAGTITWLDGAAVGGPGNLIYGPGTTQDIQGNVTIASPLSLSNPLTIGAGNSLTIGDLTLLSPSAVVSVNGLLDVATLDWQAGSISGSGIVNALDVVFASAGAHLIDGVTFNHSGSFDALGAGSGSTLIELAGGAVYNFTGSALLSGGPLGFLEFGAGIGGGRFLQSGTFTTDATVDVAAGVESQWTGATRFDDDAFFADRVQLGGAITLGGSELVLSGVGNVIDGLLTGSGDVFLEAGSTTSLSRSIGGTINVSSSGSLAIPDAISLYRLGVQRGSVLSGTGSVQITHSLYLDGATIEGPLALDVTPGASFSFGGSGNGIIDGASVNVRGSSANLSSADALNVIGGGELRLAAPIFASTLGGLGSTDGSGTIAFAGQDVSGLPLGGNGTFLVETGASLTVDSAASFASGVTFDGAGLIEFVNFDAPTDATINIGSLASVELYSADFVNTNTLVIDGRVGIFDDQTLGNVRIGTTGLLRIDSMLDPDVQVQASSIVNAGTIRFAGTASSRSGLNVGGSFTNPAGIVLAEGVSGFRAGLQAATWTSAGQLQVRNAQLTARSGSAAFTLADAVAITNGSLAVTGPADLRLDGGSITTDATGAFRAESSRFEWQLGTLANAGLVSVDRVVLPAANASAGNDVRTIGGTFNALKGIVQTGGTTRLDAVNMTTPLFDLQGGLLGGTGTLNGTLQNSGGTVSPGNSAGVLTVTEFIQLAGGRLVIEILANPPFEPGVNVDQLNVTGDAELGGVLQFITAGEIDTGNGDFVFTPIAVGGTVSGRFDEVDDSQASGIDLTPFAEGQLSAVVEDDATAAEEVVEVIEETQIEEDEVESDDEITALTTESEEIEGCTDDKEPELRVENEHGVGCRSI